MKILKLIIHALFVCVKAFFLILLAVLQIFGEVNKQTEKDLANKKSGFVKEGFERGFE